MMDRLEQAVMRELRSQLDEAWADLENERAMRAGEHDDTHSRIEKLHAELVEARAELEKVTGLLGLRALRYVEVVADRDALRAENDAHEAALLADIGTLRAENERLWGTLGHAARMLRGETEVLDQGDAYDRALDILDAALAEQVRT